VTQPAQHASIFSKYSRHCGTKKRPFYTLYSAIFRGLKNKYFYQKYKPTVKQLGSPIFKLLAGPLKIVTNEKQGEARKEAN
jgi:hypothetical protein